MEVMASFKEAQNAECPQRGPQPGWSKGSSPTAHTSRKPSAVSLRQPTPTFCPEGGVGDTRHPGLLPVSGIPLGRRKQAYLGCNASMIHGNLTPFMSLNSTLGFWNALEAQYITETVDHINAP